MSNNPHDKRKIDMKMVCEVSNIEKEADALSGEFGVNDVAYDESTLSLYAGVASLGIFKWLFYVSQQQVKQPKLIKIYPITEGNNLYRFILKQ
jgi:hypothetical protein